MAESDPSRTEWLHRNPKAGQLMEKAEPYPWEAEAGQLSTTDSEQWRGAIQAGPMPK